MTDLYSRFVFFRNRFDRSRRANLRTFHTFRTAIPSIECHLRLHQFHQIRRRTQDMILADRYTKLTSRAMLGQIPNTQGSGRNQWRQTIRLFTFFNRRKASVFLHLHIILQLFLLSMQNRRHGYQCRSWQGSTSVVSFVEDSFTEVALSALCALVYEIAPWRQLSKQSIQVTQRL